MESSQDEFASSFFVLILWRILLRVALLPRTNQRQSIMQFGDNLKSVELLFDRIEETSVLSNFVCGIEKMDDFIHNRLQEYMDTTPCETYSITMQGEIIALLTLKDDILTLDDDDKDDMRNGFVPKPKIALETPSYLTNKVFPAIEIAYLAVSKGHRNKGIGRYIVEEVVKRVRIEHPDYQFVTVDAYLETGYSAVGFYERCRFEPAEYPHGGYKDTLRMYRVLMPANL